ncbi:hypothetical protein [Rouxiella sp. WC2420]|uniref:Uncharacterized protein n=1 Tax=Rouxiella sp. WC2420 TaxID=3234145 RepID=A0AB39VK90_9GAMM
MSNIITNSSHDRPLELTNKRQLTDMESIMSNTLINKKDLSNDKEYLNKFYYFFFEKICFQNEKINEEKEETLKW